MIAGLLRAERAARLALNRAARLERHRPGWREQGMQAVAAAEEATRLALQDQPGDSKLDARLLIVLRAAVRFWRVHGHLEVPVKSELLEGKKTSLGGWLAQVRPPKAQAKRATKTDPHWARQPLNTLGMRWEPGAAGQSAGRPGGSGAPGTRGG